jgi:hypothetical protein
MTCPKVRVLESGAKASPKTLGHRRSSMSAAEQGIKLLVGPVGDGRAGWCGGPGQLHGLLMEMSEVLPTAR